MELVCVIRVITEPWRQCNGVCPEHIRISKDPSSDEELDLVQGYIGSTLS